MTLKVTEERLKSGTTYSLFRRIDGQGDTVVGPPQMDIYRWTKVCRSVTNIAILFQCLPFKMFEDHLRIFNINFNICLLTGP